MSRFSQFRAGAIAGAQPFTPPPPPTAPDPVPMPTTGFPALPDHWATTTTATATTFSDAFPQDWSRLPSGTRDLKLPDFRPLALPDVPPARPYMGQCAALYALCAAWVAGARVHLVGPPGTGKTDGLVPVICAALGLPMLLLDFNDAAMVFADLIATKELEASASGTITAVTEGKLSRAIQGPCVILVDEASRGSLESRNGLLPLLSGKGRLPRAQFGLPDLEVHPAVRWALSDNTFGLGDSGASYVGTQQMDAALLNRLGVTLPVGYIAPEDQAALIRVWVPGFPDTAARQVADFLALAQQAFTSGELPLPVSPRDAQTIARLACVLQDLPSATRMVVRDKYPDAADQAALAEMWLRATGGDL